MASVVRDLLAFKASAGRFFKFLIVGKGPQAPNWGESLEKLENLSAERGEVEFPCVSGLKCVRYMEGRQPVGEGDSSLVC